MGQKEAVLKKKPELMNALLSDIRLLKMVGMKTTDLGPGYTERYDHGQIAISALQKLVDSPNFSVHDIPGNGPIESSKDSDNDVDVKKLTELMQQVKDVKDVKDIDMSNIKTLAETMGQIEGNDLNQVVDKLKSMATPDTSNQDSLETKS